MPHEELSRYTPTSPGTKPRKMLTCPRETYDKIHKIAEEMDTSMSKTIGALVDFYNDTDLDGE